jgi:gluconolactonase
MQAIPYVWQIDISNPSAPVTEKVYPDPPLTIANGATYFNGSVYWAQEGNSTTPSAIVRMDPGTLQTEVVKNNFYGHRFNSLNDLVITADGIAFFTDGYYGYANFNDTLVPELANGVYRWDLNTGNIKMVAGAAEGAFVNPNGVALNAAHTKLFVTNRGETSADPHGGRTIYVHDIQEHGISNREIFAYVDAGFPDGIKTDREGRVYGAVVGAVDVFDKAGTLLGRIKVDKDDVAVNMAWAGRWLYIFGRNKIYRVELETEEV